MGPEDIFIWTEVFNCGELAQIVIPSFLAHHQRTVHVFGFESDLALVPHDPRVIPIRLPHQPSGPGSAQDVEDFVRIGYESGHLGTARLFAYLFASRRERYLVHFDADIIFVANAVEQVIGALNQGYALAGLRRAYAHNPHGREDVRHLPDCVDTVCLGIDREALPHWRGDKMIRRVQGSLGRLDRLKGKRALDFFDPIALHVSDRANIAYLDSLDAGPSALQNTESEFFNSFIQVWSAVGSGCAFSKRAPTTVPPSYVDYALNNYRLYAHHLLGQDFPGRLPPGGAVEAKLRNLDRQTWTLKRSP